MSISIDGKIHRGKVHIKYGEPFPIANRSMELHNPDYGIVLIYIISLGQPTWTNKLSVEIPMRYYITDIVQSVEKKYLRVLK
jgi:hypothetical protein